MIFKSFYPCLKYWFQTDLCLTSLKKSHTTNKCSNSTRCLLGKHARESNRVNKIEFTFNEGKSPWNWLWHSLFIGVQKSDHNSLIYLVIALTWPKPLYTVLIKIKEHPINLKFTGFMASCRRFWSREVPTIFLQKYIVFVFGHGWYGSWSNWQWKALKFQHLSTPIWFLGK